jgi:chlorobactene glucosyltransferase
MAGLAFGYEISALVASILALVWFMRGAPGLPYLPEPRANRRGPVTAVSVVLVLEKDAEASHCIAALQAEDYPRLQIIVVLCGARLDEVTQARIQDDPRVTIIDVPTAPPGWVRRNYAFDAGYRHAEHDWIRFLDGTVLLRPPAVERALSLAKQRGADLLTVFPDLTATSFAERLLIPFFMQLTLSGVSFRRINDPGEEDAGAFAPVFLFRRAAYQALGGYAALRSERSADSTLVQRVKAAGYRLLVAHGIELAVLVGQPGFAGIWRSWSRSFNEAIDGETRKAVVLASLVMAVFAGPWVVLVLSIVAIALSDDPLAASPWLGVMLVGVANVMVAGLHRRALRNFLKIDDSLVWFQPVAATITALMIVTSSLHLEGGRLARLARGRAAVPVSNGGRTSARQVEMLPPEHPSG